MGSSAFLGICVDGLGISSRVFPAGLLAVRLGAEPPAGQHYRRQGQVLNQA